MIFCIRRIFAVTMIVCVDALDMKESPGQVNLLV